MPTSTRRTSIIVIGLWVEDAAGDGLRARIISSEDPFEPGQELVTLARTPERVLEVVRDWLDDWMAENGTS